VLLELNCMRRDFDGLNDLVNSLCKTINFNPGSNPIF
jgi:hypothetical protein